MLFCDSDIKKSVRKPLGEFIKSCSIRHCCSNCNNWLILFGKLAYFFRKYIRISRLIRWFQFFSCYNIKWSYSMKLSRITLCRLISMSFMCYNMDDNCTVNSFSNMKHLNKLLNIMSINRAKIRYSHTFKHLSWKYYLLKITLGFLDSFYNMVSTRKLIQSISHIFLKVIIWIWWPYITKHMWYTANILGYWHSIII